MVSTAVSIDPWAVMITTWIHGLWARNSGIRSSPNVRPSRRSTKATSNACRAASATASAALLTATTAWPSASRLIASVLRTLISSSTTSTRWAAAAAATAVGPMSSMGSPVRRIIPPRRVDDRARPSAAGVDPR